MTYINEINRFWRMCAGMNLSAGAKLTYLYLLHASNAIGLLPTFTVRINTVKAACDLGRKKYGSVMQELAGTGAISYAQDDAKHEIFVTLHWLGGQSGCHEGTPLGTSLGTSKGTPKGTQNRVLPYNNKIRQEEMRIFDDKPSYDAEKMFWAAVRRGEMR